VPIGGIGQLRIMVGILGKTGKKKGEKMGKGAWWEMGENGGLQR